MSELSLSASVMIGLGLQVETLDKLPITTLEEQITRIQYSCDICYDILYHHYLICALHLAN